MLPMVLLPMGGNPSYKSFKWFNRPSASCFSYYMNMWFGIGFNIF